MADAQFVREALECAAIRERRAARARPRTSPASRRSSARQERAREADDFDRFYVLDDELHHALCDLSGHEIAWSLSQRAKGHLNRVRRLSLPEPGYLDEMIAEHRARRRARSPTATPTRAERALRHHLRDGALRTCPRIRAQHPDYFEEETVTTIDAATAAADRPASRCTSRWC